MTAPAARVALVGIALSVLCPGAPAAGEIWLGPDEPSPFVPDAARWIHAPQTPSEPWDHWAYFRVDVQVPAKVQRAVLALAPNQYVELCLDGQLVSTAYDHHECLPVFTDVTRRLAPGTHRLAARVYSEWMPALYAQLRMEGTDGRVRDQCTGVDWDSCLDAGDGWRHATEGSWSPARDGGGYHWRPGDSWIGREFALLPRQQVREHFEAHNSRLRDSWREEQRQPRSEFRGRYEKPEYADRYRRFRTLDRRTRQLLDADGREIHPFFTIYGQIRDGTTVLSIESFDFDQLERDLDLMERAHVNPYMRNLGWHVLLDEHGQWAKVKAQPPGSDLPEFRLMRDVWDYFLDRVEAHGLHVVLEADFYWSANGGVVWAPYRSRYHLYPEALEAQALATRKIMRYFSSRPCVMAYMAGEEDIGLAHDMTSPHVAEAYHRHLERQYGTVERFRETHPGNYDTRKPARLKPASRTPEFIAKSPPLEVLVPEYDWDPGAFEGLTSLADVPLPVWPRFLMPEAPEVAATAHRSYNDFTPDDPLWIDYFETAEEQQLFDMLVRWATIVREGCPDQLLFYSNAQDFTANWHFLHLLRRAELPFDVVGVGCHDSGIEPQDLEPWATTRKAIKNVSAYRPFVYARGARPVAIASGEGEGGHTPKGVLDYYRGGLFDEIGGGLAWTQTYNWLHMSGAVAGAGPHETPLLAWMAEFMPEHERDPFPLRGQAPILIVENANLQHSNRSGLNYGNVLSVAHYLTQLNVDFDIVNDQAIGYGRGEKLKVNLSPYRLIILPALACDLDPAGIEAIDRWLSDRRFAGRRTVCLGLSENRTPYLYPHPGLHPTLAAWLGIADYESRAELSGTQRLYCPRRIGSLRPGEAISLTLAGGSRCAFFAPDHALLTLEDGRAIATSATYAGNRVIGFGLFLGLNYSDLWAADPRQTPYDAPTALFEAMVDEAGIDRPIRAPHHVRVYPSADGRTLLIRERYSLATDAAIEVRLPEGVRYAGGQRLGNGRTRFEVHLEPYEGIVLSAE